MADEKTGIPEQAAAMTEEATTAEAAPAEEATRAEDAAAARAALTAEAEAPEEAEAAEQEPLEEAAGPAPALEGKGADEASTAAGPEASAPIESETPVPAASAPATPETPQPTAELESTEPESDVAPDSPAPLDIARDLAASGAASVTEGFAAVREVSAAKRAHAAARDELAKAEDEQRSLEEELDHRHEVEQNYRTILEVQNAELAEANADLTRASTEKSALEAQHLAAKDALAALKAVNERDLAPYRELASSAKGSLEDAERAAREARRSVKTAQAAAENAINTRDSRVQAAMRAADNAASRLQRLQDKLAELKRDPSTGAKELSEMSGGVAAALAQLENARADVTRVTAETSQAADIAQTHLYTQRKSLEVLEDDLVRAQADEKAKREKYNELKASADEREGKASDKVRDLASKIEEREELATVSQGRIDAATATIEEAEDIHAHPEVTATLAERVHAAMAKTEEHKRAVANLAEEERIVRERTQHSRRIFYAAIVAAAAIVIIAILVFVMK